jgi:hypothetical protein
MAGQPIERLVAPVLEREIAGIEAAAWSSFRASPRPDRTPPARREHDSHPADDDAGPFDARKLLRQHLDRERRSGLAVRVESPRRHSAMKRLSTGDPEQAEPPVPIRSARRSVAMPCVMALAGPVVASGLPGLMRASSRRGIMEVGHRPNRERLTTAEGGGLRSSDV